MGKLLSNKIIAFKSLPKSDIIKSKLCRKNQNIHDYKKFEFIFIFYYKTVLEYNH